MPRRAWITSALGTSRRLKGVGLAPDVLNVTRARMLSPSSTLNKYAYGANNPLKFVDPDGYDVTIYYRAPQGMLSNDFGHIFIGALNQDTGQVRFLDFYPKAGEWPKGEINGNEDLHVDGSVDGSHSGHDVSPCAV